MCNCKEEPEAILTEKFKTDEPGTKEHCVNTRMRDQKKPEIDLGLSLLCLHSSGQVLSCNEIAEVCGCSPQNIQAIQRNALRKLKRKDFLKQHLND